MIQEGFGPLCCWNTGLLWVAGLCWSNAMVCASQWGETVKALVPLILHHYTGPDISIQGLNNLIYSCRYWEVIIFLRQLFWTKFYQFKAMFDTPLELSVSLHRFQTLYHKPRSSPQVTVTLPEEARMKHYQDQIFVCCWSKLQMLGQTAVSAVTKNLCGPTRRLISAEYCLLSMV